MSETPPDYGAPSRPAPAEVRPLTEEDVDRLEKWGRDWYGIEPIATDVRRLVAEVRRLRALIDRVAKDACEYDDPDDECCFCGGEDGPNPEPHRHAKGCTLLAVQRETRCVHGMDRRAASKGACRECSEERER